MTAHPGYKWLIALADAQIETRVRSVYLSPLRTLDESLEQEYRKGEIAGIELFKTLVDVQISELERDLKQHTEETSNGNREFADDDHDTFEPGNDDTGDEGPNF